MHKVTVWKELVVSDLLDTRLVGSWVSKLSLVGRIEDHGNSSQG